MAIMRIKFIAIFIVLFIIELYMCQQQQRLDMKYFKKLNSNQTLFSDGKVFYKGATQLDAYYVDQHRDKYELNSYNEKNNSLTIKYLDIGDDGDHVYSAKNLNQLQPELNYSIYLCADKENFKGLLYIGSSKRVNYITIPSLVWNYTQTDIPTIEESEPESYNISFQYKVEMLPLNMITVESNNQIVKLYDTCPNYAGQFKCIESKGNVTISRRKDLTCPNSTISLYFYYDYLYKQEFTSQKVCDSEFKPIEYKLNVHYPPIIRIYSTTDTNKAKEGDTIILKCEVGCANPASGYRYSWTQSTTYNSSYSVNDKPIYQVNTDESITSYEYKVETAFEKATFQCCVSNKVLSQYSCETYDLEYGANGDGGDGRLSTTTIIVIVLSIFIFLIILAIIIVVIIICLRRRKREKEQTEVQTQTYDTEKSQEIYKNSLFSNNRRPMSQNMGYIPDDMYQGPPKGTLNTLV